MITVNEHAYSYKQSSSFYLTTVEGNTYLINWDSNFKQSEFNKGLTKNVVITIGYRPWFGNKLVCYLEANGKVYRTLEASVQYYAKNSQSYFTGGIITFIIGTGMTIWMIFYKRRTRRNLLRVLTLFLFGKGLRSVSSQLSRS